MSTSTLKRHSKNNLQMFFAYTGATLSVTLSIALSVLLFWSISENSYYSALFAGLALAFELAKFMALPEIARRKQRRDWLGGISATLLFVTLATASILGSIGGLQSDTQRVQANIAQQEQQRVSLIEQRQLLLDEITENQKAIDRYIALNRIKNYAQPLQEKNKELRQQAATLQEKLNVLGIPYETPMTALLGAIAKAAGDKEVATVQVYVFILLAVLLDLVASFFIELIREENQFKASLNNNSIDTCSCYSTKSNVNKSATDIEQIKVPLDISTVKKTEVKSNTRKTIDKEQYLSNVINIEQSSIKEKYKLVKKAVIKISVGEKISKRQMMKVFKLGQDTVDSHYGWLVEEGYLEQNPKNGLYYRTSKNELQISC